LLLQYIIDTAFYCYYNNIMKIDFDPDKNQRNIDERRIPFESVRRFEFNTAVIWKDDRRNYGETRYCALGYIGERIHHLTFTYRSDVIRVISLRKANQREVTKYAKT